MLTDTTLEQTPTSIRKSKRKRKQRCLDSSEEEYEEDLTTITGTYTQIPQIPNPPSKSILGKNMFCFLTLNLIAV